MAVNNEPLVSVVVVCLNGLEISRRCLRGLFSQEYGAKEIIVVDNGSSEDIETMVKSDFPQALFLRLDKNLGFAGGYNRGIEMARGKYVAIINNDALASPLWLKSLVEAAEKDESIGSVASVIFDGNRPGVIDSCGVGIALDGMSRQVMRGERLYGTITEKEVLAPSGCACLYRLSALRRTGAFDESFFAYCEDTDLGLRLRWAGFRSVIAPGAVVEHAYSMTTGKFSLKKVFYVERNHYWLALKNFPFVLLILLPVFTIRRYLIQFISIKSKDSGLNRFAEANNILKIMETIITATFSAINGIFATLKKRKAIFGAKKISSMAMLKQIWRHKISMYNILK
ncbi:MAG: glycosyltransferase family 2 protein [Nitrospirae bacterium]|nr:glycosyltransferase family 2 protein [Nitrospirota bacterium]